MSGMTKIEGLVAAPFTPMSNDGSLNLDAVKPYADLLVRNGVVGAFVCGTAGEGASLTMAERQAVAERWVATSGGRLRVMVNVSGTCLTDCVELARHAAQIGAAGVAAVGPYFFRPPNLDILVQWCANIAAVGLPFYYYHIPSRTGVKYAMTDFLRAAGQGLSNLAGIKYTHDDIEDYGRCIELNGGRFDMLFGKDSMLIEALQHGGRGAVGVNYNFAPAPYREAMAAVRAGDTVAAERWRTPILALTRACQGGVAASKAVMKRVGLDCGPVRLPNANLNADDEAALHARLDAIGFSELAAR